MSHRPGRHADIAKGNSSGRLFWCRRTRLTRGSRRVGKETRIGSLTLYVVRPFTIESYEQFQPSSSDTFILFEQIPKQLAALSSGTFHLRFSRPSGYLRPSALSLGPLEAYCSLSASCCPVLTLSSLTCAFLATLMQELAR